MAKKGKPLPLRQRQCQANPSKELVDAVMKFPDIREEKVRELKGSIENSEYGPTDRQIANAILADLQRRRDS